MAKSHAFKTKLAPREGYEFLVMTRCTPGGWEKGLDEAYALKKLRGDWRDAIEKYGYAIYLVHPKTYLEEVNGDFVYPEGHPPLKVMERNGKLG
jgi:hypothetical protein